MIMHDQRRAHAESSASHSSAVRSIPHVRGVGLHGGGGRRLAALHGTLAVQATWPECAVVPALLCTLIRPCYLPARLNWPLYHITTVSAVLAACPTMSLHHCVILLRGKHAQMLQVRPESQCSDATLAHC